ncbi:MAG: ATP-binding protein [Methylococcaceae bacterium]
MTIIITSPKSLIPNDSVRAESVDLSNCDRELIQYIEAIQPYGAMLVLEEKTLSIIQYSANISAFLGLADADWHGQALSQILGADNTQAIQKALANNILDQSYLHLMTFNTAAMPDTGFHLFGNRMGEHLILELEKAEPRLEQENSLSIHTLHNALPQLKRPGKVKDFLQRASDLVKTYTGFERVMIYRFEPDGSGHVIAESRDPELEAYLGLHYPASDIPEPARRLFLYRTIRFLPDTHYSPVPLLPSFQEAGLEHPVDLSYSSLRSVSLMYSVYLQNMGVKSSLVMPLMINSKVWGLISCMNHSNPRYLSYPDRIPAELLAGVIAQWLREYQDSDYDQYKQLLQKTLAWQTDHAASQMGLDFSATALASLNLLERLDADGVAIIMDKTVILQGQTPGKEGVRQLADWLSQQNNTLYYTDRLSRDYPPAAEFGKLAAGLLAIILPRASENAIFWFRNEYQQEVNWAGNPEKPVIVKGEGSLQELHPRHSFALWKQVTQGLSRSWLECEIDYAGNLRQSLTDIILVRFKLADDLNTGLEKQQEELESFFYTAAHDLKEPLIGMRNYLELIKLEEEKNLTEKNISRMDTLLQLTHRMEETIKSLMWFSTTDKDPMDIKPIYLKDLVREVAETVILAYPRLDIRIEIQGNLPLIQCDEVKVKAIYQNLIRNAVKYNDNLARVIEIGFYQSIENPVFFVRDNGIGIPTEDHVIIFQLFRRLHSSEAYGGGSGAGLTIVQKAIQRHGGNIWLDSTPGRGSTFYFTLSPASTTRMSR